MPHTKYREEDVYATSISVLKLNKPVRFPLSDEAVWMIILLAADKTNTHIDAINEVAGILTSPDILEQLKGAGSEMELIRLLKEYEMNN